MKFKNQQVSVLYLFFSILFVVCLIAANLFETKQFAFFGFSQTAGVIIFPISYIINDVVCEVWGFRKTRQLIWMGFLMNFFFVGAGAICDILPPAPYYTNQEGFHSIFGLTPRITGASFVAFLAGSLLNAYTMEKMKIVQKGKHFSVRAILSTIYGETTDSIIFFPLAFGGIIPWKDMLWLALIQVGLKTIYEIIILPITVQVVKVVKKIEN
ncbi:MAG: queuosine precursor transporter [Bacteroidales bacterium]|nr:queuosine precursor transporter [Candidatus Colimorpha pelethequi]